LKAKPKKSPDIQLYKYEGQNPFSGAYTNAVCARHTANGKFTVWVKAWSGDGTVEDCWHKDIDSPGTFISACQACLEFVEFGDADVVGVIRAGFAGLKKLNIKFAESLRQQLLSEFSEDCAATPAEPPAIDGSKSTVTRVSNAEARQKYGSSMIVISGSKERQLQPPSEKDKEKSFSMNQLLVQEYIKYCVVRSSYKWNDLKILLDKLTSISGAGQCNAVRDALAQLISAGPYRNNPVRQFVRYFEKNLGAPGIAMLEESARNPTIDRRLRAQCYQCLIDLQVEGYTRKELRKLTHENAAIASASAAAIRNAFAQAAKEGHVYAKLTGAGHESRCNLLPFVKSCIEGAGIPSDTVRKGYSYGRVCSFDLVKKAASALGVDWQMLAR
jgi:hypothetical protein